MKNKFAWAAMAASSWSLAFAGVISSTNSIAGNFDGTSGTRTVTFTGSEPGYDSGTISGVVVGIHFAKADGESFDPPFPGGTPFNNEIRFRLTGPSGTQVTLIEAGSWGPGPGTIAFDGSITFDQSAASVVNSGAQPVAGTFRPSGAGSLSDFAGQSAAGTWTLFIEDTETSDSLRFRQFTLSVATAAVAAPVPVVPAAPTPIVPTAAPEPAPAALLGLGLGAVAWLRRRGAVVR